LKIVLTKTIANLISCLVTSRRDGIFSRCPEPEKALVNCGGLIYNPPPLLKLIAKFAENAEKTIKQKNDLKEIR
jgi:hypothetical protein